jgi:hypothetical protein
LVTRSPTSITKGATPEIRSAHASCALSIERICRVLCTRVLFCEGVIGDVKGNASEYAGVRRINPVKNIRHAFMSPCNPRSRLKSVLRRRICGMSSWSLGNVTAISVIWFVFDPTPVRLDTVVGGLLRCCIRSNSVSELMRVITFSF